MSSERINDESDEPEGTPEASINSSSGRTQRPKKSRTRDGCLTCRKCKKACDKTKPSCLRCQRLSYACEWPEVKPYPGVGSSKKNKQQSRATSVRQSTGEIGTQAADQSAMILPSYGFSSSSSVAPSPVAPVYPQVTSATSSTPDGPVHDAGRAVQAIDLDIANYEPGDGERTVDQALSAQAVPGFNATVESPSRALDAQFWNQNSLYTFDYNSADLSDMDSLLRLVGLAPSQQTDSLALSGQGTEQGIPQTIPSFPNQQIVLPRDTINAISKLFPRRVGVLLDRMIAEQEGSSEVKLPLAYIVTTCLWAPSSAIQDLLQTAKSAYSGPDLRPMLNDLGEVAWSFIFNKPARTTKIAIAPEKIAAMDISLSSKLYALMDIAIRQAIVEGAGAYYSVAEIMEKLLLQRYKPGHLFNLAEIGRIETVHLYNFAFVDIMRAIQLGLPTTFAYHWAPGPEYRPDRAFSVGCSDPIMCVMSEICAFKFLLDRDANSRWPEGLNPLYQPKADEILKQIEGNPAIWAEPDFIDSEDGLDSVQHVASIASQEAWRQAALIQYYDSLYRGLDKFEAAKQIACRQILTLFPTTQLGKPHRLFGMHGLPIFMAATVADTQEDKSSCMDAFEKLSLGSAADREIKNFFERLWEDAEKIGRKVDWLDYSSPQTGPLFI